MRSSDWFGRGARAGSGIEIGPTPATEPGAIVTAQRIRLDRQRQLFPHHLAQVDQRSPGGHKIHRRVVRGVGIVAEQDVQLLVEVVDHVCQAPAAVAADVRVHPGSPKVLTRAGCLEPSLDGHGSDEIQLEPHERRIIRLEPPGGLDRTAVEIA